MTNAPTFDILSMCENECTFEAWEYSALWNPNSILKQEILNIICIWISFASFSMGDY